MLLDDALNNPIGETHVEAHLRDFLSFDRRGNTRIQVLLNDSHELQVVGIVFPYRHFRDVSHTTAVTTEVGVSGRAHQDRRQDEQYGDGHADRGSNVDGPHEGMNTQP